MSQEGPEKFLSHHLRPPWPSVGGHCSPPLGQRGLSPARFPSAVRQRGEGVLTQSPPPRGAGAPRLGRAGHRAQRPIVRPCPSHSKPVCVRFRGPAAQLGVLQARIQTSSLLLADRPGSGRKWLQRGPQRGAALHAEPPRFSRHTLSPRSWAGDAGCPVPSSLQLRPEPRTSRVPPAPSRVRQGGPARSSQPWRRPRTDRFPLLVPSHWLAAPRTAGG